MRLTSKRVSREERLAWATRGKPRERSRFPDIAFGSSRAPGPSTEARTGSSERGGGMSSAGEKSEWSTLSERRNRQQEFLQWELHVGGKRRTDWRVPERGRAAENESKAPRGDRFRMTECRSDGERPP